MVAVAIGGGIGALGRYGAAVLWPTTAGGVPWGTFLVNVVGCFGIGVLLVTITELAGNPHPLLRPFLGTGVLGGFTTFSAYGVEVHALVAAGAPATAAGYLVGTVVAALAAAQVGAWSARLAKELGTRRARVTRGRELG